LPSRGGTPLNTINESVHPSVWQRFRGTVTLMDDSREQSIVYQPLNLPPQQAVPTWAPPDPAAGGVPHPDRQADLDPDLTLAE
ncbi:MAG TPA: hypothetical protein VFJ13_05645, partial [Paracoccaceae bacterium]|nr:hypothetical protein [Paracoccaceae bacterium]